MRTETGALVCLFADDVALLDVKGGLATAAPPDAASLGIFFPIIRIMPGENRDRERSDADPTAAI
eukprot:CAMPEP_0184670212 /NCGR_PEP_ID=MMETSP0308-20130426/81228_1 /TAXON_ID=38269 /ORGANISM="Gloeochaete witrockiana, Strain SAG 46.84" /LENGTH=64 /DNA_ID=CAMNT_0027116869 /DNA_START=403 /DNA_END=594 /DNA_ORIENTATION=+